MAHHKHDQENGAAASADPIGPDDAVADEVGTGYLTEPDIAGPDDADTEGDALTERREKPRAVGEMPGEPGLPPITLDPPD